MHPSARYVVLALALAVTACNFRSDPLEPGDAQLIPTATPVGTPIGAPTAATVDSGGAVLSDPEGRLRLTVPPGTVSGPTEFSITPITNRAPGGVGVAFRLSSSAPLQRPVQLALRGLDAYPTDAGISALGIAFQDERGFWQPAQEVTRAPASNTVTAVTPHFSDWALTWQQGTPALSGVFTTTQTVRVPFSASGTAMLYVLQTLGADVQYAFTGTITAPSQVDNRGALCTVDRPTRTLTPNVAEVRKANFRWGLNMRWGLACSGTDGAMFSDEITTLFDTFQINLPQCAGQYVGTQVNGTEFVQGTYTSDCDTAGAVSASWDFRLCNGGATCVPEDPCRTGSVTCDAGLPACTASGDAPDGTSCGTDQVCSGGTCLGCVEGSACTPANACHTGILSCTGGPVCNDTGTNVEDGTSCGIDAVCGGGVCNACVEGEPCVSANECRTAAISCATGFPVCTDTGNEPDGPNADCPTGEVCSSGACVGCVEGAACTPATSPCHAGTQSCAEGPVCNDTGTFLANGTSCGTDAVCFDGVCNSCLAGGSCTSVPVCKTGTLTCDTGQQLCTVSGDAPNGTSCDVDPTLTEVCNGGTCTACPAGETCSTASPCQTGTYSCATGSPVCANPVNVADGTSCDVDPTVTEVCSAGTCTACPAGATCTSSDGCQVGTYSCATGAPICGGLAAVADGTSCEVDPALTEVCSAGSCTPCPAGETCSTGDPCRTATYSCATGAPVCGNVVTLADGTSCDVDPTVTEVCSAGTCSACPAGEACNVGVQCQTAGTYSCATGAPVCAGTTNEPDGTLCDSGGGAGSGTCSAGACQ